MSTPDTNEKVTFFLREQVAKRTGLSIDNVQNNSVLIDIGLQSIDAVLICGELEDAFQIELDPSEIFEHETLGSFAKVVTSLVSTK